MRRRFVLLAALLAGCTVGPDYQRPPAPVATAFKELKGWQPAQPMDTIDRGAWWSQFDDPVLDGLERQVDIGNQNLRAYEAAYRSALALVREARAGLFPTISAGPSVTGTRSGRSTSSSATADVTASWEPDIWGKVRRQIESQGAAAQASAADLANIRLSAQAELATDYMNVRYQDSLAALLQDTVNAYERSLAITQNQYAAGVAARSDIITAQTQLQATRAQLIEAQVARATNEHAIALLTGRAPADVTIAVGNLPANVPTPPVSVPSALLQQRPDIAAAERTMQQYNALIGVEVAAYYPTISLSGLVGAAGSPLSQLASTTGAIWTLAASGSQILFDGGNRAAAVDAARANYEQNVATYRQTVLAAFQSVEDALSTLRILQDQAVVQEQTVALARQAATIALNEYRAGTQNYTAVVTAQATALTAAESLLAIQQSRLVASISLVKALGGGLREQL